MKPAATTPVTISIESAGTFSKTTIAVGELPLDLYAHTDDGATVTVCTAKLMPALAELLRQAADDIDAHVDRP